MEAKYKKYALIITIVGAIGFAVGVLLIFTSPHMRKQPNLRTFERPMPNPPQGAVPAMSSETVDYVFESVAKNAENLQRGKTYYQYYCVFCHGQDGKGNGPVGHSYMPKPADLSADSIQAYSDEQLYEAMLHGVGHDPAVPKAVWPRHQPYLALYVRNFAE